MKNIVKTIILPLMLPLLLIEWLASPSTLTFVDVMEEYYE